MQNRVLTKVTKMKNCKNFKVPSGQSIKMQSARINSKNPNAIVSQKSYNRYADNTILIIDKKQYTVKVGYSLKRDSVKMLVI